MVDIFLCALRSLGKLYCKVVNAYLDQPPRGPGFWKFNCSLLEDCDYTENMARKIPQFIESYEYLDHKGLLREMVKIEIRSFSISFAKVKAKKREDYGKILTQEAEKLL